MTAQDRWLLPEGIEEILPPAAGRLEQLRRRLLDLYASWGYELVVPPLIEFLESLLTGTGNDLELQTFKLTDQLSGRMMGVRADMTPQVARIDAHLLKRNGPVYVDLFGLVFFLLPVMGLMFWLTWPFFWGMYQTGEVSGSIGGLIRWPAALLLPLGFGMMFLQGVAEIIKRVAHLTGLHTMDTHYEKPLQ